MKYLKITFIGLVVIAQIILNGLLVQLLINNTPKIGAFTTRGDFMLDISRGNVSGMVTVNKFGRSTNVDSGIATDVWDRANATNDQDIWVAPTQARIHGIVSDSGSDTSAGAGAKTIRVFGLTSWSTSEESEDITMSGATNVSTTKSYVIIHRMRVLTKGATNVNVGNITATADVDATITAQILAGQGQTQMAIYGVPSNQTAYMTQFYVSVNKSGGATGAMDGSIFYNPEPDVELTNFLVKHTTGKITTGSSNGAPQRFNPPKKFVGPGIIKMQAVGSANDLDVSAGFDLILIDN